MVHRYPQLASGFQKCLGSDEPVVFKARLPKLVLTNKLANAAELLSKSRFVAAEIAFAIQDGILCFRHFDFLGGPPGGLNQVLVEFQVAATAFDPDIARPQSTAQLGQNTKFVIAPVQTHLGPVTMSASDD